MQNIISAKIRTVFAVAFGILLFSCTDNPNDWATDESHHRLFTPPGFTVSDLTATSVKLTWTAIPGATGYQVALSKTEDFSVSVQTFETGKASLEIADLEGNTKYYFAIKAVSTTIPESHTSVGTFSTPSEQIMTSPVEPSTLLDVSVVLNWTPGVAVTNLVLTSNGATVQDIVVSPAQMAEGAMTVTGLTPLTAYTAAIYNGASRRGSVTFTTKASVPKEGVRIDLEPGDVIDQDFINGLTGNTVIVLPAGASYTISGVTLKPGCAVYFFGLPGAQPKMEFTGVVTLSNVDFVKFENVEIYASGENNYLINQSAACSVSEILFKDCLMHHFPYAMFRLQNAANPKTIGTLTLDGVIAYDQGTGSGYSFIHNNGATGGKIDNILIKNSTLYNLRRGPVDNMPTDLPGTSVIIADCTFWNVLNDTGNRYFLAVLATTPVVQLTNCIMGRCVDTGQRGINPATLSVLVTNTYSTTDWVTASNPIPGLISYPNTSNVLFKDPDNGNFLIDDAAFVGKSTAGDPRWRVN